MSLTLRRWSAARHYIKALGFDLRFASARPDGRELETVGREVVDHLLSGIEDAFDEVSAELPDLVIERVEIDLGSITAGRLDPQAPERLRALLVAALRRAAHDMGQSARAAPEAEVEEEPAAATILPFRPPEEPSGPAASSTPALGERTMPTREELQRALHGGQLAATALIGGRSAAQLAAIFEALVALLDPAAGELLLSSVRRRAAHLYNPRPFLTQILLDMLAGRTVDLEVAAAATTEIPAPVQEGSAGLPDSELSRGAGAAVETHRGLARDGRPAPIGATDPGAAPTTDDPARWLDRWMDQVLAEATEPPTDAARAASPSTSQEGEAGDRLGPTWDDLVATVVAHAERSAGRTLPSMPEELRKRLASVPNPKTLLDELLQSSPPDFADFVGGSQDAADGFVDLSAWLDRWIADVRYRVSSSTALIEQTAPAASDREQADGAAPWLEPASERRLAAVVVHAEKVLGRPWPELAGRLRRRLRDVRNPEDVLRRMLASDPPDLAQSLDIVDDERQSPTLNEETTPPTATTLALRELLEQLERGLFAEPHLPLVSLAAWPPQLRRRLEALASQVPLLLEHLVLADTRPASAPDAAPDGSLVAPETALNDLLALLTDPTVEMTPARRLRLSLQVRRAPQALIRALGAEPERHMAAERLVRHLPETDRIRLLTALHGGATAALVAQFEQAVLERGASASAREAVWREALVPPLSEVTSGASTQSSLPAPQFLLPPAERATPEFGERPSRDDPPVAGAQPSEPEHAYALYTRIVQGRLAAGDLEAAMDRLGRTPSLVLRLKDAVKRGTPPFASLTQGRSRRELAATLRALLGTTAPDGGTALLATLEDRADRVADPRGPLLQALEAVIHDRVIDLEGQPSPPPIAWLPAPLANFLTDGSRAHGLDLRLLARSVLRTADQPLAQQTFSRLSDAGLQRLITLLEETDQVRLLHLLQPRDAARLEQAVDLIAELVAEQFGTAAIGLFPLMLARARAATAPVDLGPWLRDVLARLSAGTGQPPAFLARDLDRRLSESGAQLALVRDLRVALIGAANASTQAPEPTVTSEMRRVAGAVWVEDAGAVLLSAYLHPLFQRFELLQEGVFADEEAKLRAIGLVAEAIWGEVEADFPGGGLAAVLCGYPVAEAPRRVPPVPDASAQIEGLLRAMIGHWSVIGNTSVTGLREAFLQRPGVLEAREDKMHLRVEARAYDMLLDRLPWSYRLIRHRWMALPLDVDWR